MYLLAITSTQNTTVVLPRHDVIDEVSLVSWPIYFKTGLGMRLKSELANFKYRYLCVYNIHNSPCVHH